MKSILCNFLILGLLSLSTAAMAHGGAGILADRCVASSGQYMIHFSAYQPQAVGGKELCWEIPATGEAIVVLDLIEETLRHRPVEVRIVEAQFMGEGPASYKTLVERPVQKYPTGIIKLNASFPDPGKYIGVATVGGNRAMIFKFPMKVALSGFNMRWVIVGGLTVVIVGFVFWYENRKKNINKPAQA